MVAFSAVVILPAMLLVAAEVWAPPGVPFTAARSQRSEHLGQGGIARHAAIALGAALAVDHHDARRATEAQGHHQLAVGLQRLAHVGADAEGGRYAALGDRKSTRLNSSHGYISYAVLCLKNNTKTLDID